MEAGQIINDLDDLIVVEGNIATGLAVDKLLGNNFNYCDEQKLIKYKFIVSALVDFRKSLKH